MSWNTTCVIAFSDTPFDKKTNMSNAAVKIPNNVNSLLEPYPRAKARGFTGSRLEGELTEWKMRFIPRSEEQGFRAFFIKILESTKHGVYRPKKLADKIPIKSDDVLKQADNLLIAVKACDGAFYRVNSDISSLVKQNSKLLKAGHINTIVDELAPADSQHGSRFVIFHPKNSEAAFLLGEVQEALKSLANN